MVTSSGWKRSEVGGYLLCTKVHYYMYLPTCIVYTSGY